MNEIPPISTTRAQIDFRNIELIKQRIYAISRVYCDVLCIDITYKRHIYLENRMNYEQLRKEIHRI